LLILGVLLVNTYYCQGVEEQKDSELYNVDNCYDEASSIDTSEVLDCIISVIDRCLENYQHDAFLQATKNGIALASQEKYLKKRLTIYFQQGMYYERVGLYNKSLENFQKVLTHKDVIPIKSKYHLYNSLGGVYGATRDVSEANSFHRKALNIARQLNDSSLIGTSYGNLGVVYMNYENFDSAKYYIKKSISFEKLNQGKLSIFYYNLSTIYFRVDSAKQAITTINKAISFYANDSININQGYNFWQKGCVLEYQYNDLKQAEKYYLSAYKIAESLMDLQLMRKASAHLAYLYEKQLKFKKAYNQIKRTKVLADSVGVVIMNDKVQQLKIKYDAELKEKENIQIKQQIELKEQEIKSKNRWLFYITSVGCLLLLLLITVVYSLRQKNKAKKIKLLLSNEKEKTFKKSEELALSKIDDLKEIIIVKNKLIKELQNNQGENDLKKQKGLVRALSNEKNWSKFMVEFSAINQNFFDKLKGINAKLTNKDLRLAALIKLHLLDKELADLLSIEPQSVRVSKNRLKEKLYLDPEVSLVNFLSCL